MAGNRYKKSQERNNRINVITAIVFLMMAVCIYKLYDVQIKKNDYFLALASDQHQVNNKLEPERGEIFIKNRGKQEDKLYPLATNKNFALVYAIPKEVDHPHRMAERLYDFFDKEKVKKEVKQNFRKEDDRELKQQLKELPRDMPKEERNKKAEQIKREHRVKRKDPHWQKQRQKEIREEIELRRGEIISDYTRSLEKENDPYERIEKRVEKKKLKEFYAFLGSKRENASITPEKLKIKGNQVYKYSRDKKKKFSLQGVAHIMKEHRYYPEDEIGSHLLGFVNPNKQENKGNYGLEGFFNRELAGEYGYIKSGLKTDESTVVINSKKYKKPRHGSDLVLTIDRSIQFHVCQKLKEAVTKHRAEQGSVVVINPETGGIIAMCSRPAFDPNEYNQVEDMQVYNNPVIFNDYEPGSVFKTITMAAALDKGKISPHTTYKDKGKIEIDKWTIKNSDYASHGPHGVVDMNYALSHSLNTGSIFAMEQVGAETFADYVKKFNFGSKTGIELEGESRGDLKNLQRKPIPETYAATASYGQGITVTPLQLVMAYAAIANDGVLMKPFVVKKIKQYSGQAEVTEPVRMNRVISEKAATLLSGMLVNVIEGGHAEKAGVKGYYVGGKTGTAQVASEEGGYGEKTIHTFVGSAPS